MRPIFQAELVNGTFGDPGVYVDLKFQRRALLFDIGDIGRLSTRKLLRTSDVFVSHAHMDHFCGFDHLLRVCLGRDPGVRVYGPAGIIEQVGHKLAAYTWNLVESNEQDFVVTVTEMDASGHLAKAQFRSRRRFTPERFDPERLDDSVAENGVLLADPAFRVRAAVLDHFTACLGFVFEEATHMNVWKNRLQALGLPTGPWLTELKAKVREGAPDDTPIRIYWRDREGGRERLLRLGELRDRILEFVPGQKVGYVTDIAYHDENLARLEALLADVDLLFIEAVFLDEDRDHAARKAHLTAHQAGSIARAVRARAAVPFHFSPRYLDRVDRLREEFDAAWTPQKASRASQLIGTWP